MLTKALTTSIIAGLFFIGCGTTTEQEQTVNMPHQVDMTPKTSREFDPAGEAYLNFMKSYNLNSRVFHIIDTAPPTGIFTIDQATQLNDSDGRNQDLHYVFYYDTDHDKNTGYYDKWIPKAGADYLYEAGVLYRYTGTPGSHEWSWEPVARRENIDLRNILGYGVTLNQDWAQDGFLGYFDTSKPYPETKFSFGSTIEKISTIAEDTEDIYLHTYNKYNTTTHNNPKRDIDEVYYNYNFSINNINYSTQGNLLLNDAGEILSDNLLYETRAYDTITIIPKGLLNQGTAKLTSLQTRADNWNLLSSLKVKITKKELRKMIEQNEDYSQVDVSGITSMIYLFSNQAVNYDITGWDVSHVTNMFGMFRNVDNFNQDINNWDVSNVTDMRYMFNNAHSFNQNISGWDVSATEQYVNFSTQSPLQENYKPHFR